MTHRERMITALTLGIPDRVPTFELEFQLSEELIGKKFLKEDDLKNRSTAEIDRLICENVDTMLEVYEKLEYDAIPVQHLNREHTLQTIRRIRQVSGWKYMLVVHGDGTFAIPDGPGMEEMAYRLFDEPETVHAEAEQICLAAIEKNRRSMDAGCDGFILCSDYCFNNGPFLSPRMCGEFIMPYLARIIEDIRAGGCYAIKHTDGNIMPILDQLIETRPHALHSLDPMAGVDIREVKERARGKVALCGNVNCALMQTGTSEEVTASAEYCMKYGKPGGGYVFCTSNVPFKGLPLERYMIALDVWKKNRDY